MLRKMFDDVNRFKVDQPGLSAGSRIASVDALRGFDMFWIIGGEAIFKSLDKIFHSPSTGFIVTQLDHVKWEGFRFYDIIMPLFLFIVGVSIPFSYRRRLELNPSKKSLWPHILKRVVILWILGMAVQGNLLDWTWADLKFYSNTLQAIASGYLIATVFILYFRVSWQVMATIFLMIVYWAILAFIPVPGVGAGSITPEGNFAIFFDKLLMGSFQDGTTYSWIISSLNFGATTMLGVFAGYLLQSELKSIRKVHYLIAAGIALIIVGKVWDIWHPSVKHIWTSSFVLFSGGICLLSLSLFVWLVDHLNFKKGFGFFTIIGMNAIFAYCAAHLFDFRLVADVFVGGLKDHVGSWFSFIRAIGGFSVLYFILWQMYKRKIFIKI
jgi:predicted acyltransferase